jgi:hypothetical protein
MWHFMPDVAFYARCGILCQMWHFMPDVAFYLLPGATDVAFVAFYLLPGAKQWHEYPS